jgi:DNA-binding LacI/PurR family transcriptional regulator
MAEQFTDMEVLTAAFGGEEGSTLITDRNGAALEVLSEEIEKGHKRIAIFYGAAHMDDFDQRLKKDFDLEPGEVEWLEAWDLRMPGEK